MEEKINFHKIIELSYIFFDEYLKEKESFNYCDIYKEWSVKNDLNKNDILEAFDFIFNDKTKDNKLEEIFRYVLVEYALERNILFLSFQSELREITIFRSEGDIELYIFLKRKFNETSEPKNLIFGTEKVLIVFYNNKKLLETVIKFYKPTERFKDKIFNTKDENRYYIIVYELSGIDVNDKLLDLDVSQMRIINRIEGEVEAKKEQLEKIEESIKEKEESLRRINEKSKKLNDQLKIIKRKMKNSENTVITILGIFVSIFTFISINTQFFKEAVSNTTEVGILMLLLGINIITLMSIFGLLYFIKKLFYEIEEKNKKGINLFLGLVFIVILSCLILIIWRMDNPIKYEIYLNT